MGLGRRLRGVGEGAKVQGLRGGPWEEGREWGGNEWKLWGRKQQWGGNRWILLVRRPAGREGGGPALNRQMRLN